LLRFFVSRQRNEEERQLKEKTFGVWMYECLAFKDYRFGIKYLEFRNKGLALKIWDIELLITNYQSQIIIQNARSDRSCCC
jgi:hypothetical protein